MSATAAFSASLRARIRSVLAPARRTTTRESRRRGVAAEAAGLLAHLQRVVELPPQPGDMGETRLGSEGNLLNPEPTACRRVELKWPVLTNEEFAKIRRTNLPAHMRADSTDYRAPTLDEEFTEDGSAAVRLRRPPAAVVAGEPRRSVGHDDA